MNWASLVVDIYIYIYIYVYIEIILLQVSGNNCVESWYSEVEQYQFGVEPRSMGTGKSNI